MIYSEDQYFRALMDAELVDLDSGNLSESIVLETRRERELRLYHEALRAHYRGDAFQLRRLFLQSLAIRAESSHRSTVSFLIEARLDICCGRISLKTLERLLDVTESDRFWKPELCFVLGLGLIMHGQFKLAKDYFLTASSEFERRGAHKKSVRSILKHLMASRLQSGADKTFKFSWNREMA